MYINIQKGAAPFLSFHSMNVTLDALQSIAPFLPFCKKKKIKRGKGCLLTIFFLHILCVIFYFISAIGIQNIK